MVQAPNANTTRANITRFTLSLALLEVYGLVERNGDLVSLTEAGALRTSFNSALAQLEAQGLIEKTKGGKIHLA